METICCPCGSIQEISQQRLCPLCNRMLYTKKELHDRLQTIYRQVESLKAEAGKLELELYSRKQQKPTPVYLYTSLKEQIKITRKQRIKVQAIAALADV